MAGGTMNESGSGNGSGSVHELASAPSVSASASASAPLTARQEAEAIEQLFEPSLSVGSDWCVLPAHWWREWCEYAAFDADKGQVKDRNKAQSNDNQNTDNEVADGVVMSVRPSAIDNSSLLDPSYPAELGILRRGLLEGEDYALVTSAAASLLYQWYSGPSTGPPLMRHVVGVGARQTAQLDLYPTMMRVRRWEDEQAKANTLANSSSSSSPSSRRVELRYFNRKQMFGDLQEELHNEWMRRSERASKHKHNDGDTQMQHERDGETEQQHAHHNNNSSSSSSAMDGRMHDESDDDEPLDSGGELESRVRLWIPKTLTNTNADTRNNNSGNDGASESGDIRAPAQSDAAVTEMEAEADSTTAPASHNRTDAKTDNNNATSSQTSLDHDDSGDDDSDSSSSTSSLPSDGWRLLSEEDLIRPLEQFDHLPAVVDVLVETQQLIPIKDEDGIDTLEWIWPREAYTERQRQEEEEQVTYSVGDEIECKDSEGKWRIVTLTQVKPRSVCVRWQGTVAADEEWVNKSQHRLAPLHTHVPATYAHSTSSSTSTSASTSTSSSLSLLPPSRSSYYSGYSWSSHESGRPAVRGAVGLRNLGNTCFMNSILSCMSHCLVLSDYFLDGRFASDLNPTNPLGWQGRVAEEYGSLLRLYWSGEYRVVSPSNLKQVIAEFQPRFDGYAQHDSSELLAFLLDGLHEDLNRVRNKPATTSVDSNGREDAVVSKEAWETYLLRNQSIVVDTLQGQFKSRLVCPIESCGRISITFDPFVLVSLPLPQRPDTNIPIHLVYADPTRPIIKLQVTVSKLATLSELGAAVRECVGDIDERSRLIFADIFSHRVFKFLPQDGSVSDIRSNDIIYAYQCFTDEAEVEEGKEDGDAEKKKKRNTSSDDSYHPVQILFHKREVNAYYQVRYSQTPYHYTPTAVPRIILIPKKGKRTVRSIMNEIYSHCIPHIRSTDPNYQSSSLSSLTPHHLSSVFTVTLSDERGDGCALHSSSMTSLSRQSCDGCALDEYPNWVKQQQEGKKAATATTTTSTTATALTSSIRSPSSFDPLSNDDPDWNPFGDEASDATSKTEQMSAHTPSLSTQSSQSSTSSPSSSTPMPTPASSPTLSTSTTVSMDQAPTHETSQTAADAVTQQPAESSSTQMDTSDQPSVLTASTSPSDAAPTNDEAIATASSSAASTSASSATSFSSDPLDIPFDLPISTPTYSYSYYTQPSVRCAFLVRLHVHQPPKPDEAKTSQTDIDDVDGDASGDVEPKTEKEEMTDDTAASSSSSSSSSSLSPAMAALISSLWFDLSTLDREMLHSSQSVGSPSGEVQNGLTIFDCLDAFTREETLSEEDPWYCSSCKEHRRASKKMDLYRLPNILILHLKRFAYTRWSREKITTPVHFPIVGLRLNNHCVNPEHADDVYDLFAVSNHMGGMGGGHYTAYVLNGVDGHWYEHDDTHVSRVRSIHHIRSSAAYILFYKRRQKGDKVKTEEEMERECQNIDAERERARQADTTTTTSAILPTPPSSPPVTLYNHSTVNELD